ncbi:MAG TPA: anti-sigma factor [Gemmatimonadaceae bacterium]
MMRELSHEEAFAALDAAALDALDSAEREAVLAHADRCESCRDELAALRATAAQLAFMSPLAPDSGGGSRDRIRARLTAHAAADAKVRGLAVDRGPDLSTREYRAIRTRINVLAWRRAEWIALAASILLIVGIGVMASVLRERENLRDALVGATASTQRSQRSTDSLRALVMYKDSLINGITGRDVAMVHLTSSAARAPNAMMFWDRSRNGWTLVAHDLPMPQPGRTYQLWLVTPTSKISAGTFMPSNGEAMVRATYALARDSLRAVAVTDEPAGGMPQPTGQMVVAGNATK